jgi:hypothetical protein
MKMSALIINMARYITKEFFRYRTLTSKYIS